ncbi:hypothetical protein EJB05_20329 [Eragrostis curvula]|uniref:Uncharacterized protein n=1 Tax=Eragrostis curvula TaxID=38414 RepID=A0A5J9UYT3_9POAL|nr:hypothetical protein EJB05_20329 [Eragrostis curvula]
MQWRRLGVFPSLDPVFTQRTGVAATYFCSSSSVSTSDPTTATAVVTFGEAFYSSCIWLRVHQQPSTAAEPRASADRRLVTTSPVLSYATPDQVTTYASTNDESDMDALPEWSSSRVPMLLLPLEDCRAERPVRGQLAVRELEVRHR